MKKASPFLFSAQSYFIDLFSYCESIPIPNTLPSKINNYFSYKYRADLCDISFQPRTFTYPKLIELRVIVNNNNSFLIKDNFSRPVSIQPIQVFTAIDFMRLKFLNSNFKSYITMSSLIYSYRLIFKFNIK